MPLPKSLEKLKLDPRVRDVYEEDNDLDGDGRPDYWVDLHAGWYSPYVDEGVHSIHETSVRYILQQFKELCECHCAECEKERAAGRIQGPKNS